MDRRAVTAGLTLLTLTQWAFAQAGSIDAVPGKYVHVLTIVCQDPDARDTYGKLKQVQLGFQQIEWDDQGRTTKISGLEPFVETSLNEDFRILSDLNDIPVKEGVFVLNIEDVGEVHFAIMFGNRLTIPKNQQAKLFVIPATGRGDAIGLGDDGRIRFSLPPGAPRALQIKAGQQIVAIGDSITQAGGYLRAMDAVLAQQYPDLKIPKIIHAGIGGQKAEDLAKRFDKDVVQRKPAIVTISIGINDVWHRLDKPADPKVLSAYRDNLERMVVMAQDAGIKVLLLAPTVIGEDPKSEGNRRLDDYFYVGKAVAKERKCTFVDLHTMFLTAVEGAPGTMPAGAPPTTRPVNRLTTDGVHMRPLGDAIMAVGVLRALGVPDEKIRATDVSKVFPRGR